MSGYTRDVVIRISPKNGSDIIRWFEDELTDVGRHTLVELTYPEESERFKDINRSVRSRVFGFRPTVTITVEIMSMADQAFLADVESALADETSFDVFLSLDGGVVERQVRLRRGGVEKPFRGKVFAGSTFTLDLEAVDLIPTKPSILSPPPIGREFLSDPSIELWSGGQPVCWSGTASNGGETITVFQETVLLYDGSNAARLTRSGGSQYLQFAAIPMSGFRRNAWYQATMRFRSAVALSANINVTSYDANNAHADYSVRADGKTWNQNSGDLVPATTPSSSSFTPLTAYLRMPSWLDSRTIVYLRTNCYYTGIVRVDGCSFYGPVLRPGIGTW